MATGLPDPNVCLEEETRACHTEKTARASVAPIGEYMSLLSARPWMGKVLSTLRAGTGGGQGHHCYKQEETEALIDFDSLLKATQGVKDEAKIGLSSPNSMVCPLYNGNERG